MAVRPRTPMRTASAMDVRMVAPPKSPLKKTPRAGARGVHLSRSESGLEEELHAEAGDQRQLETIRHEEARIPHHVLADDQIRELLLSAIEQRLVRDDAVRLLHGREARHRRVLVEEILDVEAHLELARTDLEPVLDKEIRLREGRRAAIAAAAEVLHRIVAGREDPDLARDRQSAGHILIRADARAKRERVDELRF